MAQPLASRVPKTNRNLVQIIIWSLAIFSAVVLAQRFLSGDTMEHKREEDAEAKHVKDVAQSTQSTPAAIAAMYDNQRSEASKNAEAGATQGAPGSAVGGAAATGPAPQGSSQVTAAGAPAAAGAGRPAAAAAGAAAQPQSQAPQGARTADGVSLRMPEGRPSASSAGPSGGTDSAGAGAGTTSYADSGTSMTSQRIRAQARASEIAGYEDGPTGSGLPAPNPANALFDQLKQLQQNGSGGQGNSQAMVDYLRTLQQGGAGAGQQHAPATPSSRNGGVEWLNAQQTQSNADDEPLRPKMTSSSQYALDEGTPIRIALLQDIKSDLAGDFTAMVTRDVYDSRGYGHKVISWGMKVYGRYNSDIAAGQNRLLFAFQSMRFPSGARLVMRGMPGSDLSGAAGAEGEVDHHFWQQFGSALAVGTVALIAGRAQNGGSNVTINLGGTTGNNGSAVATQALSDVVKQMLSRNENIKDTLFLKKGEELTIVTNREMDLPPSTTGVSQSN